MVSVSQAQEAAKLHSAANETINTPRPTSLAQDQQRKKEMEAYQQHIFLSETSVCNLSVVMVTKSS